MYQGWKMLHLLVVFLLFWKNADGFKGRAYSNAHQWGQPSDTSSPRTVQSSMSEAHVTGTLPVEEVGSGLFPDKPLKSRSKVNVLQFVKGGSSSYQSTFPAQTAPSSFVYASLPLPPVRQPSSSLTSSGSTISGVASGLSLETQYAASGSGPLVSNQGERSSYPAELCVSGQSTSDGLHVSSSQETSLQSAEASLPVFSQERFPFSSSSAPGATSRGSPVLLSESSGQPVFSQGKSRYNGLSQGASSQNTPDSNTKLSSTIYSQSTVDQSSPSLFSSQGSSGVLASGSSLAGLSRLVDLSSKSPELSSRLLPLVVSSQSISGQSSPSVHVVSPQRSSDSKSTDAAASPYTQGSVSYSSFSSQAQGSATSQGSSGAELSASFAQSVPTQEGSNHYSGVSQSLTASSLYTAGSLLSNRLAALPLGASSHSTSAQSSPSVSTSSTQSSSGTQLATSSRYVPIQGGSSSTSFSLKPPGTLGQYAPASPTKYVSTPMSSPQASYTPTTSSGSSYRTVSKVGSLSQTGASDRFTSQGGNYYSGLLPQSQATSSQHALGYSKLISSLQKSSSQSAGVLSSRKQYGSAPQGSSGAQFGASTGFGSQGMSTTYSGSVQSQGTTGQFATGSPSPYDRLYCKCALSPQGVDGQSPPVQSSHKHFTSSYGTQSGSSTTFTLQGSIAYDGSPQPQGTASQFAPVSHSYLSVSYPSQDLASQSTTVQGSLKPLASTYMGSSGTQGGSTAPFTLQGGTTYGGSPQDTAGTFAPGAQSSYASVSLSSPQAGPSTTVQGSLKPLASTFTGSSGTQGGSSAPFTLQGGTTYGGSPQPQGTASQFAPGSKSSYASASLSSPQAGPSTTVQGSLKQLTSTFTGSSGTQGGSSAPFTLLGSTAYVGSSQPQDTASLFIPGSSSPYASVSLSSSQGVASQSSQSYQGYSVSQSQKSQRWQPLAAHWTQGIRTSDAAASQGSSSSQSSPMQSSSLSSAGGSSRVSGPFVSAPSGSTSYDGSFTSQSLSTKYTPGSQLLPYDLSVAGQGTSSALASEVLSSYSSMNNKNAPAPSRSSSSSRFSVKG